jgi:hypothetical protein
MPENHPEIYKGNFTEHPDVKVSPLFSQVLDDFNGRVLIEYDKDRCLLEEHFPGIDAIRSTKIALIPQGGN